VTRGSDAEAPTLEQLWDADAPGELARFDPTTLDRLPPAAQRYLRHSIEAGAPLFQAARLRMHGEIKLGSWHPFEAEQVIRFGRGLIWRARAKMAPLMNVSGQDSYVDGVGRMRWRLLGLIPVMTADGPDISRSAAGRAEIDSLLLPTALVHDSVRWFADDDDTHARALVHVPGDDGRLRLHVDEHGALLDISMQRWGNPEGGEFHEVAFGGYLGEPRRFGPLTIPTTIRAGWYFGGPRFEAEGEFFRATIDAAEFR
jgi:hypothetical protein